MTWEEREGVELETIEIGTVVREQTCIRSPASGCHVGLFK
jgi:hypothetical protein